MRIIKYISILFFSILVLSCQEKKNKNFDLIKMKDNDTYEKYLNIIKEEYDKDKIPVIYYSATWCRPCTYFKNNILKDSLSRQKLKDFSFIEVDLSRLSDCKKDTIRFGDILACKDKKRGNSVPLFCKVSIKGEPLNWIAGARWLNDEPKQVEKFIDVITTDNINTYIEPLKK